MVITGNRGPAKGSGVLLGEDDRPCSGANDPRSAHVPLDGRHGESVSAEDLHELTAAAAALDVLPQPALPALIQRSLAIHAADVRIGRLIPSNGGEVPATPDAKA
jgi:hypothetical protein